MKYCKRMTYAERKTVEALLRAKPEEAIAPLVAECGKALGRPLSKMQVGNFRRALGLPRLHHKWLLSREEIMRLEEALVEHQHVVVNREPTKRMYLIPFERAIKHRQQFIARKPWTKAHNGDTHGLVSQGASHSGG